MVGASLACCLAKSRLRIAVLEQYPFDAELQPSYDDRGIALSLSSYRILNALDIWRDLADIGVPIRHIHVSDRGKFGFVHLHASDLNIDAMGYVVIGREIGAALLRKISTLENIDYLCPQTVSDVQVLDDIVQLELVGHTNAVTVNCKLLVAADGSSSSIREKLSIATEVRDYRQTAIVSNITMNKDHNNTAYERFTSQGPLALLPMSGSRFVSVFCVATDKQDYFMQMDTTEYIGSIQGVLSKRPGRVIKVGKRRAYPLKFIRAQTQSMDRTVLLGNAAHTIHPNGAQGYNLGLRDAASLAEFLQHYCNEYGDPGSHQLLQDYLQFRRQDQQRVIDFTDNLANLYTRDNWLTSVCRNTGMICLDILPGVKNKFTRLAMGIDGKQPALARGLGLNQL